MATTKKLLTSTQKTQCKQIADTDTLSGKRANALLRIHAGETHAKVAEETGLTLSQLKYWLKKFREVGMKAFPDTATTTGDATKTITVKKSKADTDKPAKKAKDKKEKNKKKEKKDKKDKPSKKSKKKDKAKKKSKK